MDLNFIYGVLGCLLVGAVAQYIYYVWRAQAIRRKAIEAVTKSIQEQIKKGVQ